MANPTSSSVSSSSRLARLTHFSYNNHPSSSSLSLSSRLPSPRFFFFFFNPHILPILSSTALSVSALGRGGPRPVSVVEEEEVLEAFFRDRELNGDLITKASDIIFLKASDMLLQGDSRKSGILQAAATQPVEEGMLDESDNGLLKLSRTQEWILGDNAVPFNKKSYIKELQDDSEWRKRMDLLNYEALKRELLLLTIGIGAACTGYCLITLSIQTAASYAIGVAFSCLYLQLLCKHVDNLSADSVPQIFRQKKSGKRIITGITSDNVKNALEKCVKGSGFALSSPRLVIPASIYGLWLLSHQHLPTNFIDFQLTPAILGMFAYKGAALVQIYRDNEELKFDFPEEDQNSIDS